MHHDNLKRRSSIQTPNYKLSIKNEKEDQMWNVSKRNQGKEITRIERDIIHNEGNGKHLKRFTE